MSYTIRRDGFDKFFNDIDRDLTSLLNKARAFRAECVDSITPTEAGLPTCTCGNIMDAGERERGMCDACYGVHSDRQVDASIEHEEQI